MTTGREEDGEAGEKGEMGTKKDEWQSCASLHLFCLQLQQILLERDESSDVNSILHSGHIVQI